MWLAPKQTSGDRGVTMGRSSCGSEVVMMDDRVVEAAICSQPAVTSLNVTRSSRVHIGPKFVSVTQNVENTSVVKGRVLGIELVSPQNTKRLRCSIAVFVCWAFIAASVLTFFIVHYALAKTPTRLDLDLPLHKYIWDVAKNTTKAERISCAIALLVLIICLILIVYFIEKAKGTEKVIDVAPHEWYITRNMWLAPEFLLMDKPEEFNPLRLVIVAHSVSTVCTIFKNCAAEMRNLQNYFIKYNKYNLPYNFLIGNDGRVYEGRGWDAVGAHTYRYNRCALGLAFIGDYREGSESFTKVTDLQLERAQMLFQEGVKLKYLHPDFEVIGAKDVQSSLSPGTNLYNAIQKWPNYAHNNIYRNRTCEQIYALFENTNKATEIKTNLD